MADRMSWEFDGLKLAFFNSGESSLAIICDIVIWRQQQGGNWQELPPARHSSFFLNPQDSNGCQCGEGEQRNLFGPPPSNFHNSRHFRCILFVVKAIPFACSILS